MFHICNLSQFHVLNSEENKHKNIPLSHNLPLELLHRGYWNSFCGENTEWCSQKCWQFHRVLIQKILQTEHPDNPSPCGFRKNLSVAKHWYCCESSKKSGPSFLAYSTCHLPLKQMNHIFYRKSLFRFPPLGALIACLLYYNFSIYKEP